MRKTAILIDITTKPGRRSDLRRLWDQHLRGRVEASAAQELYLVIEDEADPDVLHFVEIYNDEQEMQRNASAPWFSDYMAAASELLARTPSVRQGEPVWAKIAGC